jgi:hypothetical protein
MPTKEMPTFRKTAETFTADAKMLPPAFAKVTARQAAI